MIFSTDSLFFILLLRFENYLETCDDSWRLELAPGFNPLHPDPRKINLRSCIDDPRLLALMYEGNFPILFIYTAIYLVMTFVYMNYYYYYYFQY